MRALIVSGLVLGGLGAAAAFYLTRATAHLPALQGTLVFVSDRTGVDTLFARDLASGEDRQLTYLSEPVREPALSPDGTTVAFSMTGRIGLVTLANGRFRVLTLGQEWKDASPSWRPDGTALLVSALRAGETNADVHLLVLRKDAPFPERRPLTDTPGLDEQTPVFLPDSSGIVFARQSNLFRLDFHDGRTRRLTGGFRDFRFPCVLPSGRLACLWREGKRYGIDVMDLTGRNRETIAQGSVCYRTLAPSPDGRYLAATFALDLGFDPSDALKFRQTEEVRLLSAAGKALGSIERSWRFDNSSPQWSGAAREPSSLSRE
jgi:Tol biopolymer transport system component